MSETFAALLLAHVLADFVLQTAKMAANKRRPGVLAAHTAVVFAIAAMVLGSWDGPSLAWLAGLAVFHGATDAAKARIPASRLVAFFVDQALHLAAIAALAAYLPGLWTSGAWATLLPDQSWLAQTYALIAGFVLATRAGGFAVGALLAPYADVELPNGLDKGGLTIGLLERSMIFLMVLAGEPAGIGFLIAAKSVLRLEATFSDGTKHHRAAEYIIIGTLASFGWAMAASFATVALGEALAP